LAIYEQSQSGTSPHDHPSTTLPYHPAPRPCPTTLPYDPASVSR
jgi:hypothetical protein